MKIISLLCLFCICCKYSIAQKPPIDSSQLLTWPTVNGASISDDGNYVLYRSNHPPDKDTIIIKSTVNSWQKECTNCTDAKFAMGGKVVIYKKGKDTLVLLVLGKDEAMYINNVASYTCSSSEWLAYQLKDSSRDLIIYNLKAKEKLTFPFVKDYMYNDEAGVILFKTEEKRGNVSTAKLNWLFLANRSVKEIWSSEKKSDAFNYKFDQQGRQLAFIVKDDSNGTPATSLWYCQNGLSKATMLVNSEKLATDSLLTISNRRPVFSRDGRWIYFLLQDENKQSKNSDGVMVDIWSYKDKMVQSVQQKYKGPAFFYAITSVKGDQVFRLEQENEKVMLGNIEDAVIINDNEFGPPFSLEKWWNELYPKSYYLFSLKDHSKKLLTRSKDPEFFFSPDGHYVIYYNREEKCYYSYDVKTEETTNITKTIKFPLFLQNIDKLDKRDNNAVGLGGWVEKSDNLLIYDNYDVWMVDLAGKRNAVDITNGFGRAHNIKFRIVSEGEPGEQIFHANEPIIFTAFNTVTKYNGFYSKVLLQRGNPKLLSMGPESIYRVQNSNTDVELKLNYPELPVKAKNAISWIVKHMSYNKAPNYYVTRDFVKYLPISNIQPQQQVRWLTAELVKWKQADSTELQGILYKPEDFNPQNKYPIIFYYYENMSDRLYEFPKPGFITGDLNIPWFVSRGYLVFTPDIHYTIGSPGRSAYNSIVSAAKHMSRFAFVDSTKMGLQGHSFGGYETNYVITHSKLFAAAVEGAGLTDFVSGYGSIIGGLGISKQEMFENGQSRIGATLWEKPGLYIENSPVFKADDVSTPLLIMHNQMDGNVSWSEGIQLYMALRRLQKEVWLLQYDNERHVLSENSKASIDYTIRMTQFFDHYLKFSPAPVWMTHGINASKKGIDAGYTLDPDGACGKECPVCSRRNVKQQN